MLLKVDHQIGKRFRSFLSGYTRFRLNVYPPIILRERHLAIRRENPVFYSLSEALLAIKGHIENNKEDYFEEILYIAIFINIFLQAQLSRLKC